MHELDDAGREGIRMRWPTCWFLIQLADHTGIDLRSAVLEKMELNRRNIRSSWPQQLCPQKYDALVATPLAAGAVRTRTAR
jgi:hypothetical protein